LMEGGDHILALVETLEWSAYPDLDKHLKRLLATPGLLLLEPLSIDPGVVPEHHALLEVIPCYGAQLQDLFPNLRPSRQVRRAISRGFCVLLATGSPFTSAFSIVFDPSDANFTFADALTLLNRTLCRLLPKLSKASGRKRVSELLPSFLPELERYF
jgi:hypothetical protein